MGLVRAAIKLIAETVKSQKLHGRVLVIGKQDVWGTEQDVRRWLEECGLTPTGHKTSLTLKPYYQKMGFIQDVSVFKLMGFEEVITTDNSDYEKAYVIFYLNAPLTDEMAAKLGSFDLIVDSGCIEHIFNVPQVLKTFHLLTSSQGVVMHIIPSSNHVDHGLYMLSPTFFHDYYSANRWKIHCQYFGQYCQSYKAKWKMYNYVPGALNPVAFGGLKGTYVNFIAVQKQSDSTYNANVQQGVYLPAWAGDAPQTLRERLKWHVPRSLIPFLQILEAKVNAFGGLSKYLKKYKNM